LLVILFAIFCGAFEMVPFLRVLRPILVLSILGLLIVFITGQFVKVINTPIGMCILAFTVWFIACIPFGAWPGGSFHVFTEKWYKSALVFVMTAGLLTTLPQAKRLLHSIGFGIGSAAVIALLRGQGQYGRLGLLGTRYENANDFAWTLLVGVVLLGYMYLRGTRIQKATALVLVVPVLLALSKTGSREGMLGILMLLAIAFLRVSTASKVKMLLACTVMFAVILVVLPTDIRMRYTTWFGEVSYYGPATMEKRTIGSTLARQAMLKDSIRVTLMHPLLGVGPGNFPVAQDKLAKARGERSSWKVTHNSYTEVSSEMGIPGLAIYLTFLYQIFKQLRAILRTKQRGPAWEELRMIALALQSIMICFLVVACFSSLTFNTDVPILAGVTVALGFISQRQRAIDRATAQEAVVEPSAEAGLETVTVG
jgi:O-antigen ligase